MKSFFLPAFLLAVFTTVTICAQDIHGSLSGRLHDAGGKPVEGASLLLSGSNIQGSKGTTSDNLGYFYLFAVPVGTYSLRIQHISFADVTVESMVIRLGRTTDLGTIVLDPDQITLDEVTIIWEDPLINRSSHTISGNLKNSFFETMPTSRDYLSTITLLPRVNESAYGDLPNISGGTGSDNMYWINGLNVRNPRSASSTLKLPFNFVREIEVLQNGFQAEHGRSLGGIVNVITHSGTNEFTAEAFGFFTNDFLAGKPKEVSGSEKAVSDYTQYDVGIGVRGPVIKDKLWYNLAYNFINNSKLVAIPDFEPDKDTEATHVLAAKLNWTALNNTFFDFSVLANFSSHYIFGDALLPWFQTATVRNKDVVMSEKENLSLGFSSTVKRDFGRNNFFEGAVYFIRWDDRHEAKTDYGKSEPFFFDVAENSISGGFGISDIYNMSRLGLRLNNTTQAGRHQLKYGLELEYDGDYDNSVVTDPGVIYRVDDQTYEVIAYTMNATSNNTVTAAFAQDSWQISPKIMFNYGLRWEGQMLRSPIDSINIYIMDQIQPRVGMVVSPGVGKSKLYGSFGRYYAQFPLFYTLDKLCPYYNAYFLYNESPLNPGSEPSMQVEWATLDKPPGMYGPEKLKGEYADEFILGFDQMLARDYLLSIKGIARKTKNALTNSYDEDVMKVGNPGRGILDYLPSAEHKYRALEFTFSKPKGKRLTGLVSYVLSVTEGNYPGFYDQDMMDDQPGNVFGFQTADQVHNSYGYLPNDHRHNLKAMANYEFDFGLKLGTYFNYLTGAPYNQWGQSVFGLSRYTYLVPRGTAGRLPNRWDLNFRALYDLKVKNFTSRFYLDIYHIGSTQTTTMYNQEAYFDYLRDEDGNPIKNEYGVPIPNPESANPNYAQPIQYQSPMRLRLGLEIVF